jgi:trans-aconitate 2-methyltransferase
MKHAGKEELAGWIRTTWLPYTERLPVKLRDLFVKEIVCRYLKNHAIGADGEVHLGMIGLEVEAYKLLLLPLSFNMRTVPKNVNTDQLIGF